MRIRTRRQAPQPPSLRYTTHKLKAPQPPSRYTTHQLAQGPSLPMQQEKPTRSVKPMQHTAYHKAGHAVLAHFLGVRLRRGSITDEDCSGHILDGGEYSKDTEQMRILAEESFWLRMATVRYAGAEAVRRLAPRQRDRGAESDYKWAAVALDKITMDLPSRRSLYFDVQRRTRLLVENYLPEIEALARALMEREQLDADEAGKVLRGSFLGRRGYLMSY
jgi:hypothetical protein